MSSLGLKTGGRTRPVVAADGKIDHGKVDDGRVPAFDGLRGLAVLAVLLFHGGVQWMQGGFLGVSVFFTLSGFLITDLLLRGWERSRRVDLGQFWARRARRLLPATLVALAACSVFVAVAATPAQRSSFRGDGLAALGQVANWRFVAAGESYAGTFAAPSPVQHLWSLAIEGQFYLVFPLIAAAVLWAGNGSRRVFGVVIGVLFAMSAALPRLMSMSDDRIYFGTDARASEILAGALLAVVLPARRPGQAARSRGARAVINVAGAVALVVIVAAMVTTGQPDRWVYGGGLAAFAVASALVILAARDQSGPVGAVLSTGPLTALGAISFGVYLLHWPVYLWLAPAAGDWSLPRLATCMLLTVGLAVLSHRFVEQPFLRRQGISTKRAWVLGIAGVSSVAVLVVVQTIGAVAPSGGVLDAKPGSLVSDLGRLEATADHTPGSTHSPGGPLRVLVVGDSTAVALTPPLDEWGSKGGVWRAASYARIGCGVGRGGVHARFVWEEPVPAECDEWPDEWASLVRDHGPDIVIVSSAFWDASDRKLAGEEQWRAPGDPTYDGFLRDEYGRAVDVLSSAGAVVAWVDNPPIHFGYDTPHPERYGVNDPGRMARLNELLAEVAATHPSMRVIALSSFLASWPGGVFDPAVRPDGLHIDGPSAGSVAGWLGPQVLGAYRSVKAGG